MSVSHVSTCESQFNKCLHDSELLLELEHVPAAEYCERNSPASLERKNLDPGGLCSVMTLYHHIAVSI